MTGADADAEARAAAFGEDSLVRGAIIPLSGARVAHLVASHASSAKPDDEHRDPWITDDLPLLSRGHVQIVPLSWEPDGSSLSEERRHQLADESNRMWLAIRNWCSHEFGEPVAVDLSSEQDRGGYATALMRSGARRANWWDAGDTALVLVVSGDPSGSAESMSIHIVPVGWVSQARPAKKAAGIDLRWSWADIVKLAKSTKMTVSQID